MDREFHRCVKPIIVNLILNQLAIFYTISEIMDVIQLAAGIRFAPVGGTHSKTDSDFGVCWQTKSQRSFILKCKLDIARTGMKREQVWRCGRCELERLALFMDKAKIINERQTMQIALDARFNTDQPLCKFDEQTRPVWMLINEQA